MTRTGFGKATRLGGLAVLWMVTALLMARDYIMDPYNTSSDGSAAYGHNHPGALLLGLGLTLVELAVVYALLRPWSYQRSWARPLGALVLYLPWTALSLVMTVHAGGIVAVHFFWLASIVLILVICSAWSGLAAMRKRTES